MGPGFRRDDENGGFLNRAKTVALWPYSTVTDFARLRGWSTSVPMNTAA
jgi:hypothetical protein